MVSLSGQKALVPETHIKGSIDGSVRDLKRADMQP